jgi:hypothetical protein
VRLEFDQSFNFPRKTFYLKALLVTQVINPQDKKFVVKVFESLDFEFRVGRENIRAMFDLTITCNTHSRKNFKKLQFLYYTNLRNVTPIEVAILLL